MAVQNRFGVEMDTDRLVAQFMEMVQVDSESGDEARFMDWLRPRLEELGGSAQLDAYGNLIAKLPARQSVAAPILLSCHGDTVKPGKGIRPVLADGVIRSAGDTILGADDKAGIAEMIEALRVAPVRPPIEIAISRQEEVGLLGVKQLDFGLISARRGFLLDNDTLDTIITGGPSYFAIDVTVTGQVGPRRDGAREGDQRHPGRVARDRGAHPRPARSRDDGQRRHHPGRDDSERRAGHLHVCRGVPQPDPRQGPGRGRHDGRDHPSRGRGASAPRSPSR